MRMESECIIWTGCISKQGCGQFHFRYARDPAASEHRTRTSHRVALMVQLRDFDEPASQQASCLYNNKLCINVQHLVFEGNSCNNLRKTCFSLSRCCGDLDINDNRLPDCLLHLAKDFCG